MLCTESYIAT